jgi:hypothetical protein
MEFSAVQSLYGIYVVIGCIFNLHSSEKHKQKNLIFTTNLIQAP